jgi:NifU-like protein involved in Fe-S cluster formation
MKLMIKVDDKGIISDVKFKTFGCGSAIASSSYMTERVRGLSLDEAGAIKNTEIAKEVRLVSPHHERSGFPAFRISRRPLLNALNR